MIKLRPSLQFFARPGRVGFRTFVLLLFSLFGSGLVTPWAQVQAAGLELLVPSSGSTVVARNPVTHLILRQKGDTEAIRVRVEKSGVILEPIVSMGGEEQTYLHFRLPLVPGKNRFTLQPSGQAVEIKYQHVQAALNVASLRKNVVFFHQSNKLPKSCEECHDLQETEIITPASLVRQVSCGTCHPQIVNRGKWRHGPTVNQQCLSCHQRSVKPWRIGFPDVKIQDLCASCHTSTRSWSTRENIHGPLILGGCTLCHDPHGGDNPDMLWAEGSLQLCIACHSDKGNLVDEKRENRPPYGHGIIFGKGCVACHDPHATDEKFMLKKPTNELCVGCHPSLQGVTRGHPVAGHPVTAPSELRRPGRKLTCVGCHDPHGSTHQYLLVETKLGARLCRGCHRR